METVAIPITAVISYDIKNKQISVKEDFDFMQAMARQLDDSGVGGLHIDFSSLASFGSNLSSQMLDYLSNLPSDGDKMRIHGFFNQLYKVFQLKQHAESQYHLELFQEGLDTLKFELMKLSLLYDSMPESLQKELDKYVPDGSANFKDMLVDIRNKIKMRIVKPEPAPEHLNTQWLGVR